MSLKARLRIAIVALATLVVIAMSTLYLYDFTNLSFRSAFGRGEADADEVYSNLKAHLNALPADGATPPPASMDEVRERLATAIRTDPAVSQILIRTLADDSLLSSIRIVGEDGETLAASDPSQTGAKLRPSRPFKNVQSDLWLRNLWNLMTRTEDYSTSRIVGVGNQSFFRIVVAIKSDFIRHDVEQPLTNLAVAFAASLIIAAFLGAVLPNLVLDPLGRMSQTIDSILSGQPAPVKPAPQWETREFAAVQTKLTVLGEQFRGAKQDALELRSNMEQLVQGLEEAVLLFDGAGRLLLAGAPAERLLGKTQVQMTGRSVEDLFPLSSTLGAAIQSAVQNRRTVRDQTVTLARDGGPPQKLLVSVQVLARPGEDQIGTLVEVRDVESRRQLERQLDLSSRLAALSRLTGGVAHEIKNPLNAMALQLEVLRTKLDGEHPEVAVIAREIKRLDNVVKTFLNFNRPVELEAKALDLNQLVSQILDLVAPEAAAKRVRIDVNLQPGLNTNGDANLLQQAVLNVINNAMEAMPDGGTLTVRSSRDGSDCRLEIGDSGAGIPPELRDRIFNLYFTTKQNGSGIGLATTFRVVQLHGGTIDFVTQVGKGTTFRLRFPGMVDYRSEVFQSASGGS